MTRYDCVERTPHPTMQLPDPADLVKPRWRPLAAALAVALLVGLILGIRDAHDLASALGDTDDAMRMVMVRDLLSGRGWWDQHLMRLQPPMGVYMHWSRLLDGGIAALERVFALGLSWRDAEWMTRLIWPLLWIFPAALAMFTLAERLRAPGAGHEGVKARTPGAILVCAVLLASNINLYLQFHPGRVDHHDVQMTCCFLALAGAAQRGPGG